MAASFGKLCCNQLPLTARKISSGWLRFRAQGAGQFHPGPWRSLSSGRQRFNAASLGLQARIRPFPLLIATGGGYMGYDQYGHYKDRELTKIGIEVPPRIANETQLPLPPGRPVLLQSLTVTSLLQLLSDQL